MFHLNNRIHSASGASPFALMFGRSPFSRGEGEPKLNQEEAEKKFLEFWNTYNRDVVLAVNDAKRSKRAKQQPRKKFGHFNIGDHVMYRPPTTTKYQGVYRIKDILPGNRYILESKGEDILSPANFLKSSKLKPGEDLYNPELDTEPDHSEEGVDDFSDKTYQPSSISIDNSSKDISNPDIDKSSQATHTLRRGSRVKKPNSRYITEF